MGRARLCERELGTRSLWLLERGRISKKALKTWARAEKRSLGAINNSLMVSGWSLKCNLERLV